MGMIPILVISPLALARQEEPVLEPPLPIFRVDSGSSNTGGHADEDYSPSRQAAPHQDPDETETEPAVPSDPTHQVNLFA